MTVTTRFAPSPTGRLHVGNARTALIDWLFTRANEGRFILRLDDTDAERSSDALAAAIEEDLHWLGLDWDERHRQSDRTAHYELAFRTLSEVGRVYACYETPEELAARREAMLARGVAPIYDRAGRRLSEVERRAFEAEGRKPHWRFALEDREVAWDDLIQGGKLFQGARLGDPVVRRADGTPTYLFASAIDDLELGITHVIRGEDHVANTAVQVQIMEALGGWLPRFAHLPLLVDGEGRNLSKRLASLTLDALRERGLEPLALGAVLAALGTPASPNPIARLEDLIEGFALSDFGRAPPRFDPRTLERFNAELIHHMPSDVARARLAEHGVAEIDEPFWNAIRANLETLDDARIWWAVCHEPLAPIIEEPEYLAVAADLLPRGRLGESAFEAWIDAVRRTTGRKGRALYRPLRLALTAREHGPELKRLLPIIDRARVVARLRGETA